MEFIGGLGLRDYYFETRGDESKLITAPYTEVVSEVFWVNRKLFFPFAILCSQTQMPRNRNMANIWSVWTGFQGLIPRNEGR